MLGSIESSPTITIKIRQWPAQPLTSGPSGQFEDSEDDPPNPILEHLLVIIRKVRIKNRKLEESVVRISYISCLEHEFRTLCIGMAKLMGLAEAMGKEGVGYLN
jgi:hypothetical protein